MVGVPAREVIKKAGDEFCAYGTPEDVRDPLLRTVNTLCTQVKTLTEKIDELESRLADKSEAAPPRPRRRKASNG